MCVSVRPSMMQTIKNSVGWKVFVFYAISMMLVFVVTGYLFYIRTEHVIHNQISSIAKQAVDQTHYRIDRLLSDYDALSVPLMVNPKIQNAMLGTIEDPLEKIENLRGIELFLGSLGYFNQGLNNVYFINDKGQAFNISRQNGTADFTNETIRMRGEPWYDAIYEGNGSTVFLGVGPSFIHEPRPHHEDVFSFGRTVKDVDHGYKRVGIVLFEVEAAAVTDILQQVDFNETGETFIVDDNRRMMAGNVNDEVADRLPEIGDSNGIVTAKEQGKAKIYIYQKLRAAPWTLVVVFPRNVMIQEVYAMGWYMLYITLIVIPVSLLIAFLVARYIHRPTTLLLRSMRKAEQGNLAARISARRKDEFGQIFTSFNVMMERLKSSIDEVYVQQLLKKDMQYKVLSSQINTHFLYNTLNSVYWMAKIGKSQEIAVMVRSLSDYLEISLNEGEDEMTVDRIFYFLKKYISIQRIRYDILVTMHMDEQLKDYKLPKNIFQPIVENAFYHGIEKIREQGKLDIRFEDEGDAIRFQVTDNGAGMSQQKLSEIRSIFEDRQMGQEGNFALKNIYSQIQFKYGLEYRIQIESNPGEGTQVTLILPKK